MGWPQRAPKQWRLLSLPVSGVLGVKVAFPPQKKSPQTPKQTLCDRDGLGGGYGAKRFSLCAMWEQGKTPKWRGFAPFCASWRRKWGKIPRWRDFAPFHAGRKRMSGCKASSGQGGELARLWGASSEAGEMTGQKEMIKTGRKIGNKNKSRGKYLTPQKNPRN